MQIADEISYDTRSDAAVYSKLTEHELLRDSIMTICIVNL